MKVKSKVCILTSSHRTNDARIFYKEAKSIAGAGYETAIIVPHPADEVLDGIRIKSVPNASGKLGRFLLRPLSILMACIKEEADIYHFHDPELIPVGLILKLQGKKAVYDVHEYYRQNLLSKRSLPWGVRHLVAYTFDILETCVSKLYDGVIVVDRLTGIKFKGRAQVISNYPYSPKKPLPSKGRGKEFKCVYAGGLSADRGLFKMIKAMEHVNIPARLTLIGPLSDEDRIKAEKMKGYEKVERLGLRSWPDVLNFLPECDLGLVLLQPVPAYIFAGEGTIKLFEYMASGLPVLSSNFVNLERIIKETGCGSTVDPTNPNEIAKQIMYFADNPEASGRMGESGIKAVMEKYNWEKEAEKLLALYGRILDTGEHKVA
ncbi:MAG: glycosyltransferase family 4 protein [Nitrospirota bacterium]